MQALEVLTVFLAGGDHIQRTGIGIDDRRGGDANLRINHLSADVRARNGSNSVGWVDEAILPERVCVDASIAVGIERIDAVVLRGNVDDVVLSLAWHGYALEFDRLRINLTVHGLTEQLAEACGIYVRGCEHTLVEILAGAKVVVMVGHDIDLAPACCHQHLQEKNGTKPFADTPLNRCHAHYLQTVRCVW